MIGRAIRATAEDPDTVGLVGVNARRVNAIAAAIALATVAVAGAFLGMRATFDPYAGAVQLIFAFEASVIGGAGSLWGTLIGGIVLGVAQSLGALVSPRASSSPATSPFSPFCSRGCSSATSAIAPGPRSPAEARHERDQRRFPVERWTPESRIAIAAAAVIVAALAIGPAIFSANAVDKLTTLFIYVILPLMWNALVGFCGLVSIGQQAFFGLGAYAAIRLADLGVSVYPSLFLGALIVGALSWPLSLVMLRLKGGEFAIGMWVVVRARASARQSRHAGSRRNRHLADRAQRLFERQPPRAHLLVRARCDDGLARNRLFALAQPARRGDAGDPRQRGGGGINRRAGRARQAAGVHARRLRRGARRRALGRDCAHLPAQGLFQPAYGPPT